MRVNFKSVDYYSYIFWRKLRLIFYVHAGDLTVENFFKELTSEEEGKTPPLIDNALVKLDSIAISRAIVNFNGAIIVQV